jgi:hypothetical protein
MAALILNVVFMNFIIAVISESYDKVMMKLVPETFRVKAELIGERELNFTSQDYKNSYYFPKYILLRRVAS